MRRRLYRSLCGEQFSPQVRAAAWRGVALADAEQRVDLVAKALSGNDRSSGSPRSNWSVN